MSAASLLKVYDGQEPDLCFGTSPGPGGVNSVGVGAGLQQTGSSANPVVSLGMSAVGDLLVGTGAPNAGAVLAKGANGNFLRVKPDGTGLEYAAVAPGGVDSVAAVANNVGLVLTTAPATPTDPQIGLAFTAKADIPVGTAASTGVMVSAPLPLTSGLVLTTDTGEASGVKWAPAAGPTGVISTNAPLKDTYSGGNNLISIDFSTTAGEIPYGTGAAETGALLAPPSGAGAVGKVLTYNGIVQGQPPLAWTTPVSPVGGDTIIIHSNAPSGPSNLVPVPNDKNTQLILVAGELAASWDKVASTLPGGADYAPELRIFSSAATGNKEFMAIASEDGAHGRVVVLYDFTQNPAEAIGTFEFQTPGGSVADDAFMFCYCNGDDPYNVGTNFFAGTPMDGRIILGGKFNKYISSNAVVNLATYSICALNVLTTPPQIEYLYDVGQEVIFGFTNSGDPVNDNTTEIHTIIAFPANALAGLAAAPNQSALPYPGVLIGGTFDTLHATDGSGQPADVVGYGGLGILFVNSSGGSVEIPTTGPMKDYGLWISSGTTTPTTCSLSVNKMIFDSTYSKIYIAGENFEYMAVNQDGSVSPRVYFQNTNGNSYGFIVYDTTAPYFVSPTFNVWLRNNDAGQIPPFNSSPTWDIAFSNQLAGYIIGQNPAGVYFVNPTAPTATWVNPQPIAAGNSGGFYNSICPGHFVNQTSPTPAIVADWVSAEDSTNQTISVAYIQTATGTTLIPFNPDPTGVVGSFVEGFKSAFGLQPVAGSLLLGGTDGQYQYDPAAHTDIKFTTTPPMFWKDNAGVNGLTIAEFTAANQSQSYIASSDLKSWIQIGATNPNLSYS